MVFWSFRGYLGDIESGEKVGIFHTSTLFFFALAVLRQG